MADGTLDGFAPSPDNSPVKAWGGLQKVAVSSHIPISNLLENIVEPVFMGDVSELLTKSMLEEMDNVFGSFGGIDRDQLEELITKHTARKVSKESMETFFARLDVSIDGTLQLSQLSAYMHLLLQQHDAAARRARDIRLKLPGSTYNAPHVKPIARVRGGAHSRIWTMCEGARLTEWPGRVKDREPYVPLRSMTMEFDSAFADTNSWSQPPLIWATDFCFLPSMEKLVIGSGERKLYFYESAGDFALQFVVQFPKGGVPLKITQAFRDDLAVPSTTVLWGDTYGNLSALVFPKYYKMRSYHFRMHVPKGMPPFRVHVDDLDANSPKLEEFGGVHYRTWQGHSEAVTDMVWIESKNIFVSASTDTKVSMIVGEMISLESQIPNSLKEKGLGMRRHNPPPPPTSGGLRVNQRQTSFTVSQGGIRTIDYSEVLGLIASGGIDRVIRLWSPHLASHPAFMLTGHEATITALMFKGNNAKNMLSLDMYQCVRVWDVKAQTCITTVTSQMHGEVEDLTHIYYHEHVQALMFYTKMKVMALKVLTGRTSQQGLSHMSSIRCMLYNERFKHIVTSCDDGIIKSWSCSTGAIIFEFRANQGEKCSINSMVFDDTYTKLIIAFDNGSTTRWQYSTGQHLGGFVDTSVSQDRREVTNVLFSQSGQMKSVITVGWSRKVSIFRSLPDSKHVTDIFPHNNWSRATTHADDITAACLFGKNSLVTGAYDGEVIVWNLSTGRPRKLHTRQKIQELLTTNTNINTTTTPSSSSPTATTTTATTPTTTTLSAPPPAQTTPTAANALQEYVVLKLVSIQTRVNNHDAAELIVSTTTGIYFWNTKEGVGGELCGMFKTGPEANVEAKAIVLTEDCENLIVGDSFGRVTVYDIRDYCNKGCTSTSEADGLSDSNTTTTRTTTTTQVLGAPPILSRWRAHKQTPITAIMFQPPPSTSGTINSNSPTITSPQTPHTPHTPHQRSKVSKSRNANQNSSDTTTNNLHSTVATNSNTTTNTTTTNGTTTNTNNNDSSNNNSTTDHHHGDSNSEGADNNNNTTTNTTTNNNTTTTTTSARTHRGFVLTCSDDCRARLWTTTGEYVGTFGQHDTWDTDNRNTWQHPRVPTEIQDHDEMLVHEKEQDTRLEHMQTKAMDTNVYLKPAAAWGLEKPLEGLTLTSDDTSTMDSHWGKKDLPQHVVDGALSGVSSVAKMKFIGGGDGISKGSSTFYARRSLPKDVGGRRRVQSAPVGLRTNKRLATSTDTNKRTTASTDTNFRGPPKRLGNQQRHVRGVAPSWSTTPKDKINETTLVDMDGDDIVNSYTRGFGGFRNNSGSVHRVRAKSAAAAPGRKFNRYRDSVGEVPESLHQKEKEFQETIVREAHHNRDNIRKEFSVKRHGVSSLRARRQSETIQS